MNFFCNFNMFMNNGLNFTPFSSYSFNNISIFNNFSNPAFNNCWNSFSFGDTFTYSSSNVKSSDGKNGGGSVRQLYNSLGLEKEGLSYEIFAFTMQGYNNLSDKGNGRLGIIDPYKNKYYLIDMKNKKFIDKTDVILGRDAASISAANKLGSGATLSGFEKVKNEYRASKKTWSNIGIRREGLEIGINDMSMKKGTVIHSMRGNRTQGCIGVTPVYKNGQQDNRATDDKLRRLFTTNTILFTYPKNVDEYKRLSNLV